MIGFSFLLLRPPRTSEALKMFRFWILDLKVCLKKLGIGSDLYAKSVMYLGYMHQKEAPNVLKEVG